MVADRASMVAHSSVFSHMRTSVRRQQQHEPALDEDV